MFDGIHSCNFIGIIYFKIGIKWGIVFGTEKKWFITGFIIVSLITGGFWLKNHLEVREEISYLARNPPGKGETEFYLEVLTEDGSYPMDVRIQERLYTDEELEVIFQQGIEWINEIWLGENPDSDHVSNNLYFPTYIDSLGLNVRWEVEHYQWIQADGKITEKAFLEAPCTTEIAVVLSYKEHEVLHTYSVTVVNPKISEAQEFQNTLKNTIQMLDESNGDIENVALPDSIQNQSLIWYERQEPIWPKVFVFGNIIVILLYFTKEEKKIQQLKNRDKELSLCYPDIVYRLILLIGAGMTVKSAWENVTKNYEKEKERTGKTHWGYEEMLMTLREMNYGIAEIKAYENFGKRCGGQNYIRLSSLLIQQVKRGAKGMNQLLMQEVLESEIIWRENSRKRAEEAGTKLLLPMILLMTVVFAVLMIPAFLSMSM